MTNTDMAVSLSDEITYKNAAANSDATSSAILGPFWREDTPHRDFGTTISFDTPADAEVAYMFGAVRDAKTGKPIPNATVDIWEASTNGMFTDSVCLKHMLLTSLVGLYEQQDQNQREHNLRGIFTTNAQGEYALYCIRPTPYPVSSMVRCFGRWS